MTTQPKALRLAELIDWPSVKHGSEAAAELRRLHGANQELLEALRECLRYGEGDTNCEESYIPPTVRDKSRAVIAKHGEKT